ncbi:MAG: hypothetical protein ABIQ08_02995 [Duganella sp.]
MSGDTSSSADSDYMAPGGSAASSNAGTSSQSSRTSGETGSSTAGTGSGGTGSMGSSSTGSTSGMGGTANSGFAQTSHGTVQAIDQMQRQDVGVGAMGAAAAGGAMAGSPTDRVYRVTVRMDDGSSQLIVVDSMPPYKIGDRVRYNNGTLSPY